MPHLSSPIDRPSTAHMNDMSDLCLLGVLFDKALTFHAIKIAIEDLDTGHWRPVRDVIGASLLRLIKKGEVVQLSDQALPIFSITPTGIRSFFRLLRQPLPLGEGVNGLTLNLKSQFLPTLPLALRRHVAQQLCQFYQCQLRDIDNKCAVCPIGHHRTTAAQQRQRAVISKEIDWLSDLTAAEKVTSLQA